MSITVVFIACTSASDVDCLEDNALDGEAAMAVDAWEIHCSPQVAGKNCFWNRVFATEA